MTIAYKQLEVLQLVTATYHESGDRTSKVGNLEKVITNVQDNDLNSVFEYLKAKFHNFVNRNNYNQKDINSEIIEFLHSKNIPVAVLKIAFRTNSGNVEIIAWDSIKGPHLDEIEQLKKQLQKDEELQFITNFNTSLAL